MLTLLTLRDFVIVPEMEAEASTGLTCLTGETGAGKSILIDALQLVLGARSDITLIREGAERTEVAAEFTVPEKAAVWLAENGIESGSGSVLMRRTVDTKGRSRCWINGTAATAAQARDLGSLLVDIHGQHASQSLMKASGQMRLLDGFGGCLRLAAETKAAWEGWQEAEKKLQAAVEGAARLQAEAERLAWTREVLEELAPAEGEWESISAEQLRLANASDIIDSLRDAFEKLSGSGESADSQVSGARNRLLAAARYDEACAGFAEALGEASAIIEDTARGISRELGGLDVDGSRLEELDERVSAYWRLAKKFHRTPETLWEFLSEVKIGEAQVEEGIDTETLREKMKDARNVFMSAAERLLKARQAAAGRLSEEATSEMQHLAMAGGRLVVDLSPAEPWAGGINSCTFLVAGHEGATPRPLAKVASGGELSRISLAIAVVTAQVTPVPTLIFDEIDSGIGGATAEVVGRLLHRLSTSRQVLCVTHLPQVAACADQQWQVSKRSEGGRTESSMRQLGEEERVEEIARMLGGVKLTGAARAAAREMIAAGRS